MSAAPDRNDRPGRRFPGLSKTTIEWIRAGDCHVRDDCQRPLDEKRAQEIADNLDPDQIGIPFVVEVQDGRRTRYIVIDGQHRIEAIRRKWGPDQLVRCEVIRGVSIPRAAALFVGRNNAKQPQAIAKFRASVTQGDPEAVQITKVVESLGLKIDRVRGKGTVQAVKSLQRIYRGDRGVSAGPHVLPLKRTLNLCLEAWGPHSDSFNGDVLLGLGLVMTRHGDIIDIEKMVRKLKQYGGGPLRLLGNAKGLKAASGGTTGNAVATVIVNLYGHGKGGLPHWRPESD